MSEEWRAVPGYEGRYEVSNMGQVRSLTHETVDTCGRRREFPGKVLAATPTAGPYPMINLRKGPSSRAVRVHELVLLAFVGPRPEGLPHIRHLNDIPTDNRLENLAYGTAFENMHDWLDLRGHHNSRKTHCKNGHEFTLENTVLGRGRRPNTRTCLTCLDAMFARRTYKVCDGCGVKYRTTSPSTRCVKCRKLASA